MIQILIEALVETFVDSVKLLPFLFITYLSMEYLEHKASAHTTQLVRKSGKLGPLAGGILGIVPQCGFSAAASNFYAGRVITLGSLLAIYLSTSDEMLPILISEQAPIGMILKVLLCKVLIGTVAGFLIDLLIHPKKEEDEHIHEICEHEHCDCEKSIFKSSLKHTLQIFLFIFVIGFVLEMLLMAVGEDALKQVIYNQPILAPVLAGLVGLIPNCAASVAITELYLKDALGFGAMLSGLLVNAGVGLVVLFKVNRNLKENLFILGLLYMIGVVAGSIASFLL